MPQTQREDSIRSWDDWNPVGSRDYGLHFEISQWIHKLFHEGNCFFSAWEKIKSSGRLMFIPIYVSKTFK